MDNRRTWLEQKRLENQAVAGVRGLYWTLSEEEMVPVEGIEPTRF